MTKQKDKHEPSTLFLVDIKTHGSDLVELTGICTGYIYSERSMPTYLVDDIEKAARKALASVESYRRATAQMCERLSRDEYEALQQPGH